VTVSRKENQKAAAKAKIEGISWRQRGMTAK